MFTMVGVLAIGFVANLLITVVSEDHFDELAAFEKRYRSRDAAATTGGFE